MQQKKHKGIAIAKYVRIAPRKARLAAGIIRGKTTQEAITQLTFCNLKAGPLLKKTLMSAIANAETQADVRREDLYITEARVDEGPVLKRSKTKSRGRRDPIHKRMSHLYIGVGIKEND